MNRIIRAADALGVRWPRNVRGKLAKIAAVLVALMGLALPEAAAGAQLNSVSVTLSDPQFSAPSVNYDFTSSGYTATPVECVIVNFSTDPVNQSSIGNSFTSAGAAVTVASSTLLAGAGTWVPTNTANQVKLVDASNITAPTGGRLLLTGIHNASQNQTSPANGGYWYQLTTYSDSGCITPIDNATTGFVYSPGSLMSLTVNDTLTFSIAGHTASSCMTGVTATTDNSASPNTIPFGTVTAGSFGVSCQVLSAATNATNGFTIYIRDNGPLANTLGEKIPDVGGATCAYTGNGHTNLAPGTFTNNTSSPSCTLPNFNQGAYGYTTDDSTLSAVGSGANRFTNGAQQWASYGQSTDATANAEVAYEPTGVSAGVYTIAHQVGVTTLTQPGYYTTTVIYTCTPIY